MWHIILFNEKMIPLRLKVSPLMAFLSSGSSSVAWAGSGLGNFSAFYFEFSLASLTYDTGISCGTPSATH